MKKRTSSLIFILLFFAVCLVPSLGMLVFGAASPSANEILARPPKPRNADGQPNYKVLSDFADYVDDRFALRQEMVSVWSWLNVELLHTSAEEQVILGTDNWLYYVDTEGDYCGQSLDDSQLMELAQRLASMQDYVESKGGSFIFTVAPNKNTLYPENMPSYIQQRHSSSNLARLPVFLKSCGVNYVDLVPALSGDERLYYITDTHWTAKGAALAADTLLESLYMPAEYSSGSFEKSGLHKGDLYEMLYPCGTGSEAEFVYNGVLRQHRTTA